MTPNTINPVERPLQVAVIGSGGAAMAGALRAASLGARVTLVERGTLGGTCVNVGCVPSKTMIRAAEVAHLRANSAFDVGLSRHEVEIDRPKLVEQQQRLVAMLRDTKYRKVLDSEPAITVVEGNAAFQTPHSLRVRKPSGQEEEIRFDYALIATGALPYIPPIPGLAETPFWTSTEALNCSRMPRHLIIIGSSIVAVELAQAFVRLGSRVTILARRTLLHHENWEISEQLSRVLTDEGVEIMTGVEADEVAFSDDRFMVVANGLGLVSDALLIAAGRAPNTRELGLDAVGVVTRPDGAIEVDDYLRTSAVNIFAAGDCTTLPQFVYVAAAAGTRAADNMLGRNRKLDLSVLPRVIFTDPEAAAVGWSEAEAAGQGIKVATRTLSLEHLPRAVVNHRTDGLIKMIAEVETGRILGVRIVAAGASEVIETAALAIRCGLTVTQLADELFPYLTMTEGLKLTAQSFSRDVAKLSCCAG